LIERKGDQLTGPSQVRVVKSGPGVLYLSGTLNYVTREENVQASSSSEMNMTRDYLRLRVVEEGESARWSVEPLTGELRSGDMIVARLRIRGNRAQYLMVEDPIPAGCEQIEQVSGISLNHTARNWGDWYSAREFRDNRTAFFLDSFDGDVTFQYAMRVIIPGDFRVLPARTELMYQPAIQANTNSEKLKLLDKR
jgi:uncharacterized protein YfaS (alpha-2-macroglobulin family)